MTVITVIGCEDDDEDEVPASVLQKYQLGRLLHKVGPVSVRRCEDRSDRSICCRHSCVWFVVEILLKL